MLRIEETRGRTYGERMTEAMAALPLLSKEWTNYNPSDPGMTILENLIAFEALQGSNISSLRYEDYLALLKIAGFTPGRAKCSRLLLSAIDQGRKLNLPANQKFRIGELVFETRKNLCTGGMGLKGIFSYHDDEYHNISFLADREFRMSVKVFGDQPSVGDSIYFISDALPEPGEETSFFITLDSRFNRNPVEDRTENIFSALTWEYYTGEGFKELKTKDYTGAFLSSGEIKFRFPQERAVPYEDGPEKGYCIRAVLSRASYDVAPKFKAVNAFLFEVWQKDSRSVSVISQKSDRIEIKSPFNGEDYLLVFAKEEKGSSYRRYELRTTFEEQGRFCRYERKDDGTHIISFDEKAFGYAPAKVKDPVRVVIYSEEIMRRYRVGRVIGYDDQEIELPINHIVPDSFCLIAKRMDENGEEIFNFVRPGKDGGEELSFHLLENDGKIVITDPGEYIGAELFMAGAAVTEGPRGNIRAGNRIYALDIPGKPAFYNPGPGIGGAYRETLEEVRERFRKDITRPYTCVTAEDYERVVLETPGLCIRKAHAVMDELENLVHIAVMPGTDETYPKLSDEYKKAIKTRLSERRLITTRFQIKSPVYAAVSVKGTIYVKRHFSDCREQIEKALRYTLNYMESDRNFGETLRFEDVFRTVEELDCVEYIYELFIRPEKSRHAYLKDSNIYIAENCLLYPGQMDLEIVTFEK